jgi:hypothetical protein
MKMNDELRKAGREFDERLKKTIERLNKSRAEYYKKTGFMWRN